jgi:hypothetical protein
MQRHFPVVRRVSLPTAANRADNTHATTLHTYQDKDVFERSSGPAPGKTSTPRESHRSSRDSPASNRAVRGRQDDESSTQAASQAGWWASNVTIGTWTTCPDTIVLILVVVALLVLIALSVQKAADGTVVFFSSYFDLFLSHLPLIVMVLVSIASSASENENAGSPSSVYTGLILMAIGYNYIKAFSDNSDAPALAFCVGTGRITVGYIIPILALVNLLALSSTKREGQSDQEYQTEKLSDLISLAGCIWLISKLVGRNPRKVHYTDAGQDSVDRDGGLHNNQHSVQNVFRQLQHMATHMRL